MNSRVPLRLLAAVFLTLSGSSCKTWNKHFGKDQASDGYTSASAEGGYNPYPGSSGTPSYQEYQPSQPQPSQPQYQTYTPPQQQQSYAPSPDYTPSPDYSAPPSSPAPKKKKSTSTGTKSSRGGSSYTVKGGDTLYRIARNKGTTVSKIKSANGLTSDLIRPGQTLKIP